MTPDAMNFLQTLFNTLGSIWYHRNLVVHDGLQLNPLDVVLMTQILCCRYQNAFIKEESQYFQSHNCSITQSSTGGAWQIIIKIASARRKKFGTAYAFETKNRGAEIVFRGIGAVLQSLWLMHFKKP